MRAARVPLVLLSLLSLAPLVSIAGCGGRVGRPPVVRQSLDDARVTTGVKSALLNDAQIGSQPIDVQVHDGIVALSGTVRTQADAARAEQLAHGVAGVKDVKSSLKIQS